MTFWKIIRTRKIILKITTLLSKSKCMKLANWLPIGNLHSTAKVTMWLLPCLMFGTTPSEPHHTDRTGFLRFFRWGNKWSICSRSQRVSAKPSFLLWLQGKFYLCSPHTQGRVEYWRQDLSYNKHAYVMKAPCDGSSYTMGFRELWDCYIHIST